MSETDEGEMERPTALEEIRSIAVRLMFGGTPDERSLETIRRNDGNDGIAAEYRELSDDATMFAFSLIFALIEAGRLEDFVGPLDFRTGYPLNALDKLRMVVEFRRGGRPDVEIVAILGLSSDAYEFACDIVLALTVENRLDVLGPLSDEEIPGLK